jgi:L-alanine-DL-glutamate epimerase-like enolase superfamily enzyme
MATRLPLTRIDVSAYTIPTDFPESDGTIAWDHTTIVIVEAFAGNEMGIGYTYGDLACGRLVDRILSPLLLGRDALAIPAAWVAMQQSVRNIGRPAIASMAIAAVDAALWDLKARLLGVSLVDLLGRIRDGIPVYGSGGFTSYSLEQLQDQFSMWASQGISRMKMKVGRNPAEDVVRVRAARSAIGDRRELFVDANGAYTRKQALRFAFDFLESNITWFEEPVSSDDLDGLRLIRDRAPAGMDIAAGEYGYDTDYFRRMLSAGAVDVLQADGTRCGGISGFLRAETLAETHHVPLSAHTAPSLHAHVCCACPSACHIEYFHDHVRIEHLLFDGVLQPIDGVLYPDTSRPGNGLVLKHADVERYAA